MAEQIPEQRESEDQHDDHGRSPGDAFHAMTLQALEAGT